MKKLALFVSAMAFAGLANATVVVDDQIQQPDCAQLNEDVSLSISSNVVMAYNCPGAGNSVGVAACHTAGRQSSRTVEVNVPAGCGVDADGDGNIDTACTGTQRQTTSGSAVFVGATAGGSLRTEYPGAACDDAGSVADGEL
jgi:hypothetical protein